jgi:hypothetical protein
MWAVPTVQTLGMSPALAAPTSQAISYCAMVLSYNGNTYLAKWNVEGAGGSWSAGGALPCEAGKKISPPYDITGSGLPAGLPMPGATPVADGKVKLSFNFNNGATVLWTVNKCGQNCITSDYGANSTTTKVTFTPCPTS